MKRMILIATMMVAFVSMAQADLFEINLVGLTNSYAYDSTAGTGVLSVFNNNTSTSGYVKSVIGATTNQGDFKVGQWSAPESFLMTMGISNITATTADADAIFTLTDNNNNAVSGAFTGTWTRQGTVGKFIFEPLTSMTFTDTFNNNQIQGHTHYADMLDWTFDSGYATETDLTLLFDGSKFLQDGWFDGTGTFPSQQISFLANATVVPVPVPAAFLIGMLGLGVAGARLRKYV